MVAPEPSRLFSDLPGEVRNQIYRLALVCTRSVTIRDLHPDEYAKTNCAGHCARTTYVPHDCQDSRLSRAPSDSSLAKTTYCLHRKDHSQILALGLLALNRRARHESVPIFYGENTFKFTSISCVIPFLTDRAASAQASIKSLKVMFCFPTAEISLYDKPKCEKTYHSTIKAFERACSDLAYFDLLRLTHFEMRILDNIRCSFFESGFSYHGKAPDWMHHLSLSINNLDHFVILYGELPGSKIYRYNKIEEVKKMDKRLWEVMAPKMVKDIGRHSRPYDLW